MKRWKPPRSIRFTPHVSRLTSCWSGRWDLNPRQPAWKAGTLPLSYARPSLSAECPVLSPKPYFSFAQRSALITQKLPASSFGGQARIRTLEADGNRFTVCPLWPLGYLPETLSYDTTILNASLIDNCLFHSSYDEKRKASRSTHDSPFLFE
jgi:hypothetical protein